MYFSVLSRICASAKFHKPFVKGANLSRICASAKFHKPFVKGANLSKILLKVWFKFSQSSQSFAETSVRNSRRKAEVFSANREKVFCSSNKFISKKVFRIALTLFQLRVLQIRTQFTQLSKMHRIWPLASRKNDCNFCPTKFRKFRTVEEAVVACNAYEWIKSIRSDIRYLWLFMDTLVNMVGFGRKKFSR